MILFILSKENISLAKTEAEATFQKKGQIFKNILIINGKGNYQRLAYTQKAFEILCKSDKKKFLHELSKLSWENIVKGSFSVKNYGKAEFKEEEVAKIIWNSLRKPKVNLKRPDTALAVMNFKSTYVLAKLLWTNPKDYMLRRAHLRPVLHPSSLHPKLARACVNLLGPIKGRTIVDPFCGTGGILIETALLGNRCIGYDIDSKMLDAAQKNLEHFNIRDFRLLKRDALNLDRRLRYVVTDLPYGKNTKDIQSDLYEKFIYRLKTGNIKKAVVIFPDTNKNKKILKKASIKIISQFSCYIHKRMKKRIILMKIP